MTTLVLVSCVSQKLTTRAPAKDLYISAWFKKARAYAEQICAGDGEWVILSANHGAVNPCHEINPYEKTLSDLGLGERTEWLRLVTNRIASIVHSNIPNSRVVLLAGSEYRKGLEDWIKYWGATVEVPMRGMGIGEQLRWLTEQTKGAR